jgi:alkanesulfonate monooxygenase SsuD/methylene tetrahydromethanopterin reductase-like flavin-dependent oxidoreductase (luciferase family)
MLFGLRFDFRNPSFAGTTMADRYAAAIDMAAWADALGCVSIAVSEHHGSEDGYLPSPIPVVAAMAARTTSVRFMIAALIAPFHDPLRLAEDLAVLDQLSRGRLDVIVAGGYVPDEFEMFGVARSDRVKRVVETVTTLKSAFTGEPFTFRGRTVRVTPAPFQAGGPKVTMGGSSEPAARRAARIADGFIPSEPHIWGFYREEMLKLGKPDPGEGFAGGTSVVTLATDPEGAWAELAPYFLHESNSYGAWQARSDASSPYRSYADAKELRAGGQYRILTPEAFVAEMQTAPLPFAMFQPLCGGIPPELGWESLRLFEREVLPAFAR